MGILIKNRSPKPTRVEAWGIEQPTVGKGPWVTGQGPLPTELPGYGKVQFALDDASLKALMRRPQVIYAEDEREKKWRANRKTVRRAIDLAKLAVERNSKRLPIIQTPRSVFRPAPPESRPPKGRIFGDPKDQ